MACLIGQQPAQTYNLPALRQLASLKNDACRRLTSFPLQTRWAGTPFGSTHNACAQNHRTQ